MVQRAKDCHNEVIVPHICRVLGVIKRLLKDNTCSTTIHWLKYDLCITCAIKLPPSAINIEFSCFGPYLYSDSLSDHMVFSCPVDPIIDQLMTLNRQELNVFKGWGA